MENPEEIYIWECSLCGGLIEQHEAPDFCPLCENENIFFIKQEKTTNEISRD